ncbi:HAD-IIA family hydrolase [Actinokineospora sp.]|uniref:HAD-IIA family hydrolase n=1 Tax=Actinokineospora sp. TaxID=1872133 RepID=UPI004037EFFC
MSDRLLDVHDALLLDLDGTVYRGGAAVPGATEAIAAAREHGVAVRFVTNNASRAPIDVARQLTGLGIAAEPGDVRTSAQAGAAVLAERLEPGGEVLVVGTRALVDEVHAVGLTPVRVAGPDTVAVVQGLAPETSWGDLAEACVAIRAGALWVACNVDRTLPTDRGLLPGNGAMVQALRAATDREPVVAGKPALPLMRQSIGSANSPLVVGDRLDTDIEGAVAAGIGSLLVLTGVTTTRDVLAAGRQARPTYLAADLSGVTETIRTLEITAKAGWDVRLTADGIEAGGHGDPLDLLRTLCACRWTTAGPTDVRPTDDAAAAALTALGLTDPH